jgi:2,5-diketo-D-gluconate reductase B
MTDEHLRYVDVQGVRIPKLGLGTSELRAIAKDRELALIAYSPLAQGKVREDETLQAIARDLDATPEQVVLRWLVQQPHVAAIPRSSSAEHLRANFEALSLPMDTATHRRISGLARGERLVDPSFAPTWSRA